MDFNGCLTLTIILALTVGLVFRQLTEWQRRRDSESTSRTDHGSGEENEALNSLGIEGSETTGQMKRKRSSEAIQRIETKTAYEYDVFLSFCGGDTRLNFTDNLYHRMKSAGICVFLDSEELKNGKKIVELLKAVDESRIYIPIFSQKFASRSWCLREIARMVDRHSESDGKREIIPVFYDVEPNDVKLITNLYNNDILKHKNKKYRKSEEVDQWTRALKEVGSMVGRVLKGKREGEEIESIVKEVVCKLGKHVDVPGELVEDYRQIKDIIEMLDLNSGGVRFVGIHGTGGIGKTTLVKVVFKKLCSHFDRVSFLDDVRKSSEHGLVTLQKELLRSVGSYLQADQIQNTGDGMYWIKAVCQNKKVLIVLDDLDDKDQLKKLAGKFDWFGSGSRIIITSRDESILKTQVKLSSKKGRNRPEVILCYAVREMAFDQALLLFRKHAFPSDSPIKDYDVLSENIVRRVACHPLAIEVIGSYLYEPDPHKDNTEVWKETLKKLDKGPLKDVRDALKISYEGLEKEEKHVFLDIACFFTNEDQTYPVIMWDDCGYCPKIAIRTLCVRSLIKIRDNKFWMHDQVRDLGRYIVLEEHTPKFSRVWTHEDAVKLLKRKKRNEDVEALSLISTGCSHNFADEELAALPELRFLRTKGLDFSGDFKNHLSNLRWLSWQTWQSTFRAKNFRFSRLAVLNLSDSNIEDGWDAWNQMEMDNLKVLDLTGCMGLKRTPDLSNFTSLETLILARCVKLTTIDRSISKLEHLRTFNINGCKALRGLPTEFGSLRYLEKIIMPQHYQHFKLPETFGGLHSLSSLILDEHPGISELPNSIGGLVNLTRLSLCECVGIKKLPSSIGKMEMLAELDLSKSGIDELPDSIGSIKKLKVIRLSYTMIGKFPHTIGDIEMLEELHAKKCSKLTDENLEEIGKLSNLRILDMSYTSVSRFPTILGCLSRLETLEMCSSHPQKAPDLPSSLKHLHMQAPHFPFIPDLSSLVNLDYLELSILTLPMEEPDESRTNHSSEEQVIHPLPSSLSTMKFREINLLPPFSNLEKLSEMSLVEYPMPCFSVSQDLTHLRVLKLRNCLLLEKIPGLALLKNLWWLELNRLDSLVEIHDLWELQSLEHFRIAHCYKIDSLPNLSKLGKLRHIELEACPNIRELEGVKGTERLKLDKRGCTILERLLDDPESTWLSHRIPTYDVFLSFRGMDTRYSIVEILYKNLLRNKILVYRYSGSVTTFSCKNYASGVLCSDKLVRSVEWKRLIDMEKAGVKLESNLYRDAPTDHRRIRRIYGGSGICKAGADFSNIFVNMEKLLHKILSYRDDKATSHDSHIYIPFLSKNYASSERCLNELARIVECQKSDGKRRILPIFYDVEKADVKLESNLYRDAMTEHRRIHRSIYGDETEEWGRKVKEWEEALKYVGSMEGYDLKSRSLEQVIDLVTKAISEELLDADVTRPPAVED